MEPLDQNLRRPAIGGQQREHAAFARRIKQASLAIGWPGRPSHSVPSNGDNARHQTFPMAFTKGLAHDRFGFVASADYARFVEALTQFRGADYPDAEFVVPTAEAAFAAGNIQLSCQVPDAQQPIAFRKWESPLAGAYFCNDGPDPAGVAMAPAPRFGGSELIAEIAEVYAMALVRDMDFADLENPAAPLTFRRVNGTVETYTKRNGDPATVSDLVDALNDLAWFNGGPVTGTLTSGMLTGLETRRREARGTTGLTAGTLFRGSTPGSRDGDYISQFMVMGTEVSGGAPVIRFGAQTIDQRVRNALPGLDYMTSWAEWRDVQQGLALGGTDVFETTPSLITTPRHLASYVHIDQLYQAYFNACLILLGNGMPADRGFPNVHHPTRGAFASFGGPHILSLMTEVATRGLRAVRRQKFQIHRRARPERLAAILTLRANGLGARLGNARPEADDMVDILTASGPAGEILHWIAEYNAVQNDSDTVDRRQYTCTATQVPNALSGPGFDNYLLPMAFPEGSPMHPAYGAGHATVAGACVTVLKAFFEMFEINASGMGVTGTSDTDLARMDLVGGPGGLTIEGELNKLASNISIGRNFAGVHYYTDYYDSLRMGERVAVGMLHEMMLDYNEPVSMTFRDFDGDLIQIGTNGGAITSSAYISVNGDPSDAAVAAWWGRNVHEFADETLDTGAQVLLAAE